MASRKLLTGQHDYVYKGITLNKIYMPTKHVEKMTQLPLNKDDVIVAGYPRSGTHWMQQVIWLIKHKADTELQKDVSIDQRVKLLDVVKEKRGCDLDELERSPHPWLMKTHMPAGIFEKQISEGQCKIVVIIRNPKDVLVSNFYFRRTFNSDTTKNMATYFEYVKSHEQLYGDWLSNVTTWWDHRDLPNVHVIKYEDMKAAPSAAVRQLAKFMEVELTEDQIELIVEQTTFNTLKNNLAVNCVTLARHNQEISPILRKGEVGDWKEHFNQDMNDYIEETFVKPASNIGLVFSDHTVNLS